MRSRTRRAVRIGIGSALLAAMLIVEATLSRAQQSAPASGGPRPGTECLAAQDATPSAVIVACNALLGALRGNTPEQIGAGLRRRAEALAALGRLDEAVNDLQEMIRRGQNAAQGHALIGGYRSRQGRQGDAETSYREAIRLDAGHVLARIGLGQVLMSLGRNREAAAELRQATTLAPNDPVGHLGLGIALHAAGDLDGSLASLDASIRLSPQYVAALLQRAQARLEKGNIPGALADADAAVPLTQGEERVRSLIDRGRIRQAAQNSDGAATDCIEAERLSGQLAPQDARLTAAAAVCAGIAHVSRGELQAAGEDYERALKANPSDVAAHNGLGYVAFQRGRYEEAAARFEAALKVQPQSLEALRFLGLTHSEAGVLDKALAAFERAITADAKDPWPLMLRATALARAGERERALRDADAAIRIAGAQASNAWLARGGANYYLDDLDAARRDIDQSLRLTPTNGQAHLTLGRLLIRQGRLDEAGRSLEAAQRTIPQEPSLALNRGLLALARHDYQSAVREIGSSLAVNDAHAEAFSARGQAYEGLGRQELAITDYRTSLTRLAIDGDGRRAQALARERLAALEAARITAATPAASGGAQEAGGQGGASSGNRQSDDRRRVAGGGQPPQDTTFLCRFIEGVLVHSRKYSGVELEVGCR
ncbi:MAG: tetratricopeptide repeat protein [Hyphomicrobiaceae bacterium]|nr:tetratricopeptide repeat protein [Hyphomicrobiaceae bacterium]